eukprot:Rmarinus@m.3844
MAKIKRVRRTNSTAIGRDNLGFPQEGKVADVEKYSPLDASLKSWDAVHDPVPPVRNPTRKSPPPCLDVSPSPHLRSPSKLSPLLPIIDSPLSSSTKKPRRVRVGGRQKAVKDEAPLLIGSRTPDELHDIVLKILEPTTHAQAAHMEGRSTQDTPHRQKKPLPSPKSRKQMISTVPSPSPKARPRRPSPTMTHHVDKAKISSDGDTEVGETSTPADSPIAGGEGIASPVKEPRVRRATAVCGYDNIIQAPNFEPLKPDDPPFVLEHRRKPVVDRTIPRTKFRNKADAKYEVQEQHVHSWRGARAQRHRIELENRKDAQMKQRMAMEDVGEAAAGAKPIMRKGLAETLKNQLHMISQMEHQARTAPRVRPRTRRTKKLQRVGEMLAATQKKAKEFSKDAEGMCNELLNSVQHVEHHKDVHARALEGNRSRRSISSSRRGSNRRQRVCGSSAALRLVQMGNGSFRTPSHARLVGTTTSSHTRLAANPLSTLQASHRSRRTSSLNSVASLHNVAQRATAVEAIRTKLGNQKAPANRRMRNLVGMIMHGKHNIQDSFGGEDVDVLNRKVGLLRKTVGLLATGMQQERGRANVLPVSATATDDDDGRFSGDEHADLPSAHSGARSESAGGSDDDGGEGSSIDSGSSVYSGDSLDTTSASSESSEEPIPLDQGLLPDYTAVLDIRENDTIATRFIRAKNRLRSLETSSKASQIHLRKLKARAARPDVVPTLNFQLLRFRLRFGLGARGREDANEKEKQLRERRKYTKLANEVKKCAGNEGGLHTALSLIDMSLRDEEKPERKAVLFATRATLHLEFGDPEACVEDADRAIEVHRIADTRPYVVKTRALVALKRFSEAAQVCRDGLDLVPSDSALLAAYASIITNIQHSRAHYAIASTSSEPVAPEHLKRNKLDAVTLRAIETLVFERRERLPELPNPATHNPAGTTAAQPTSVIKPGGRPTRTSSVAPSARSQTQRGKGGAQRKKRKSGKKVLVGGAKEVIRRNRQRDRTFFSNLLHNLAAVDEDEPAVVPERRDSLPITTKEINLAELLEVVASEKRGEAVEKVDPQPLSVSWLRGIDLKDLLDSQERARDELRSFLGSLDYLDEATVVRVLENLPQPYCNTPTIQTALKLASAGNLQTAVKTALALRADFDLEEETSSLHRLLIKFRPRICALFKCLALSDSSVKTTAFLETPPLMKYHTFLRFLRDVGIVSRGQLDPLVAKRMFDRVAKKHEKKGKPSAERVLPEEGFVEMLARISMSRYPYTMHVTAKIEKLVESCILTTPFVMQDEGIEAAFHSDAVQIVCKKHGARLKKLLEKYGTEVDSPRPHVCMSLPAFLDMLTSFRLVNSDEVLSVKHTTMIYLRCLLNDTLFDQNEYPPSLHSVEDLAMALYFLSEFHYGISSDRLPRQKALTCAELFSVHSEQGSSPAANFGKFICGNVFVHVWPRYLLK